MAERWDDEETGGRSAIKDNWDDDDDTTGKIKDSWEDEDDDVKDNWDEEEDTSKKTAKKPAATAAKKPAANKVEYKEMTEEEKKQAQEAADLRNAMELMGLNKGLDELSINTKEDYLLFINVINSKVSLLTKKPLFGEFLDELIKALCKDVSLDVIKKISGSVKAIHDAKLFEEKAKAKENKPKAKSKGKIKVEFDSVRGDFDTFLKDSNKGGATFDDDGDDFM